ncbi:MAG: insulinase family protein [Bacteroidales bacterium]
MQLFIKVIAAFLLLSLSIRVFAQDVQKLPNDPRVKTGKLANGLTYYIIKNEAHKGYANFCIAQKVGTTLEGQNQKGMFKALELLATRGTRNFTDSTITQYLHSVGVENSDIVFNTNDDDITYLIKNVPIGNQNTIDSSLLILYNWLGSINIDEEDITKVMPLLKNTMMNEWGAAKRIDASVLMELFPRSSYARSINPSEIAKMESYSSKDLRNFYYQWCRPNLQAIFVVGDIDTTSMETRIKSVFSTIPKPLKNVDRNYYKPKQFNGVKVIIHKDPEYNKTLVTIDLLKEPLPAKYKETSVPYIEEYMDKAISQLLFNRIQDGIIAQNLPISNVKIEQGNFMNIHNLDKFSISFETQPNMVYSSISYLSIELDRMAKYGFNNQEFTNSRDIYFRLLETLYDNRFKLDNDIFLKRALNNYLDNYSLASIEMHFELMKEILYSLTQDQLNEYAKAMVGQKDNVVITCKMPQIKDDEGISKERVLSAFNDALAKSPSSYLEAGVVKWPKFYTQEQTAEITSQIIDPITGAYVLILSNGATAVLKKTYSSKDTISFKGVSKGGLSLMNGFSIGDQKYFNDILNLGGVGDISQPTLEKLYSYHNLRLNAGISPNTEELAGSSNIESVEKLFQVINLSLTSRRADEKAFNVYKRVKVYEAAYHSLSPLDVFKDSVEYYNSGNKKYIGSSSPKEIDAMEYSPVLYASRTRFSNAADFVFIFTGNMDNQKFAALATKYLGNIPGDISKREDWQVVPNYLAKGNVEKRFLHQMVIPRTYVNVTLSSGMPYSIENYVLSKIMNNYLEKLYTNGQIKNMASKSNVKTMLRYYPEEIMVTESNFETDSISAGEIVNVINNELYKVSYSGIDSTLFYSMIQDIRSNFNVVSRGNNYWINALERRYITKKDFHNNFLKVLGEITPNRFSDFVKDIKENGNNITVIMEGTTEDVKTKNLFKDNKFIKDFFEL